MREDPVTADEFNALLALLGWSNSFLAYSKLGMTSDRAVRRWRSGQNRIPPALADWLRLVARALQDLPPPKEWE
jgi:hypothetical protein